MISSVSDCLAQKKSKIQNEEVFYLVEEMPLFNGSTDKQSSDQAIAEYFKGRVQQESLALEGKVYVTAFVDTSGHVPWAVVKKGISPRLDSLALVYVKEMPKFSPGMQRDRKVIVEYSWMIKFE